MLLYQVHYFKSGLFFVVSANLSCFMPNISSNYFKSFFFKFLSNLQDLLLTIFQLKELPKPLFMDKSLRELGIGTFKNVITVRIDTKL